MSLEDGVMYTPSKERKDKSQHDVSASDSDDWIPIEKY